MAILSPIIFEAQQYGNEFNTRNLKKGIFPMF